MSRKRMWLEFSAFLGELRWKWFAETLNPPPPGGRYTGSVYVRKDCGLASWYA